MTPKRSIPLWWAIYKSNEIGRRGDFEPLDEALADRHFYNKVTRLRHPKTTRRKFKGRYVLSMAVNKMIIRRSKR